MELFAVGTVEITPRATAALAAVEHAVRHYLARHQSGDWGEDADDSAYSDFALRYGHQVVSNYTLPGGVNLLVITAADRSATKVLCADEFEQREVGLREGYAIWSAEYDAEKNPLIAVEEPRVDALLDALPMTAALDVGTGTGRHALRLARRGARVAAIDQSPEMLALARQAAEREGLEIDLRLGTIEDGLPFGPQLFDLLVCALMLCHVADLGQAMSEFFRVLRPGGYLLITDFHPDVVAMGWRSQHARPGINYLLPNSGATRADYLRAASAAGFRIESVSDMPIRDVPTGFLPDAIHHKHADTALCLIVLAQRPAVASS